MEAIAALYGGFTGLPEAAVIAGIVLVVLILGYTGASFWLWIAAAAVTLFGYGAQPGLWGLLALIALLFGVPPIRRHLITAPLVGLLKKLNFLPTISDTERTAIEAGNVWVDGELFSGKPNFERILREAYPDLTEEERAFLEGPVEEVCRMTNDWEVFQRKDLPPEVWDFIKKHRFLGLIIPKEYGGLGFSPLANSAVVVKLVTRCGPLSTTVMVPNSLGPAELLLHYGTEEQKKYYLPRLARGEEIPCFALTEPHAGSDAGGIQSTGVVFRGEDGKLYLRLNFRKRYITLAGVATLIGLAFKLHDPENLLGKGPHPGITCALIPADTPGVNTGRRHDPLGVPFYNCPIEGEDVVVPVDAIIGGPEQAGNGWRMLVESLAAGRGISLPASGTGGVKYVARILGAYTTVRKQFGMSIGKFGGIQEPLARVGGWAYLLEAARRYTCGGLNRGEKPSVITAIAKYNFTEIMRKAVNDGMDVLGGAGISRGPRNLLAHGYFAVPINITVEGANILTRTLMIFGQGAIRCHPYAYKEISALMNGDVAGFDAAFWPHIGHVVRNLFRSVLLSLTRGRLARSPVGGPAAPYFRKIAWASATFALMADVAMGRYGGNLKRMEELTGRFADVFSWLYLATATLRRFEAEGRRKEDLPLLHWSMQYALSRIQEAFDGIFQNMGGIFRWPIAVWSRLNPLSTPPSDRLGQQIARILTTPGEQRDRLTEGIYISRDVHEAMGRLENAFRLVYQAEPIWGKIRKAIRKGDIQRADAEQMAREAVEKGIITSEEAELLVKAEAARDDVVQVDSFTQEEYMHIPAAPGTPQISRETAVH
ncbi:MAG: acyl-CoA dehydrogenase [Calditrichaeota bacterium]|nr:MAG: acyl-CoA dehydrogenase [Calditrichota bacterium]